jgi:hypothetical protein
MVYKGVFLVTGLELEKELLVEEVPPREQEAQARLLKVNTVSLSSFT